MSEGPTDAGPPAEETERATGAGTDDPGARRGGADETRHAWRLIFAYDGDQVRVLHRQRVRMQAPPDESPLIEQAEDGYWLEIRDRSDAPVYRQVLHRPIATEYEVFSPDGMRHVAAPEVSGVFQTVVPDLAEGDALVLHGPAQPVEPPSDRADTGPEPDAAPAASPESDPWRSREAAPGGVGHGGRTLLRARLRAEENDRGNR